MKIHFLLPAYNEAENIERQVVKLIDLAEQLKFSCEVNVIDDGSTDNTAAIVKKLQTTHQQLHLICHEKNAGPGKAFMTGYAAILQKAGPNDAVISMDADNTHSEQTIRMMLAKLSEGYELIIASVFAPGGMMVGLPFIRYFLTLACNGLYRILFPVPGIKEYTGFYRAIQVGALKHAMQSFTDKGENLITARGFGCAAEMLIKCRRVPLFMVEVPMMVRYDKKGGKSKLKIFRTIAEHLRIISTNLWQRNII